MQLIASYGYELTWYIMESLLLVSILLLGWIQNIIKKEPQ